MGFRRLHEGKRTYIVNLDAIAYMRRFRQNENTELTKIVFAPRDYEDSNLEILVDETPEEIVGPLD